MFYIMQKKGIRKRQIKKKNDTKMKTLHKQHKPTTNVFPETSDSQNQ